MKRIDYKEIDRLKSLNKELVEALEQMIIIKRVFGYGGSTWDHAEAILKKAKEMK